MLNNLTPCMTAIMAALQGQTPTVAELQALPFARSTIANSLTRLMLLGLIEREAAPRCRGTPGAPRYVYKARQAA
jgi:predicted transcriptional regulator